MLIRFCSVLLFLLPITLSATAFQCTKSFNGTLIQIATRTYGLKGKTVQLLGTLKVGSWGYYQALNRTFTGKSLIYVNDASWPNVKPKKQRINSLGPLGRRGLACVTNDECLIMAQKFGMYSAIELIDADLASHLLPFATLPNGLIAEEMPPLKNFEPWLHDRFEEIFVQKATRPESLSERIDIVHKEKSALLPSWNDFLSSHEKKSCADADESEQFIAKILSELIHFEMGEKGHVVVLEPAGSMPYLEKELVSYGLTLVKEDWIDYVDLITDEID